MPVLVGADLDDPARMAAEQRESAPVGDRVGGRGSRRRNLFARFFSHGKLDALGGSAVHGREADQDALHGVHDHVQVGDEQPPTRAAKAVERGDLHGVRPGRRGGEELRRETGFEHDVQDGRRLGRRRAVVGERVGQRSDDEARALG